MTDEVTTFRDEFIGPDPDESLSCDCECCDCCAGRDECAAPEACVDRGCGRSDGKRMGEG